MLKAPQTKRRFRTVDLVVVHEQSTCAGKVWHGSHSRFHHADFRWCSKRDGAVSQERIRRVGIAVACGATQVHDVTTFRRFVVVRRGGQTAGDSPFARVADIVAEVVCARTERTERPGAALTLEVVEC